MDFRQLNIKLTPGVDDDIAERLERYAKTDGGRTAAARRLLRRALGLAEPPLVIQADEATLRRVVREECKGGKGA